ncbi:MAG TPA: DUF1127 domain-containing protein [Acetobacteraceae bacterium]
MSDRLLTIPSFFAGAPLAPRLALAAIRAASREWRDALLLAHRTASTRRALRDLDPRLLADIGVTASHVGADAARPFWHPRPARPGKPGPGVAASLTAAAAEAWRRRQTRRILTTLDARLLKDIGASPTEAGYEANKPFWRA